MEVNREALEMQAQLAQTKAMEAQEKGEIEKANEYFGLYRSITGELRAQETHETEEYAKTRDTERKDEIEAEKKRSAWTDRIWSAAVKTVGTVLAIGTYVAGAYFLGGVEYDRIIPKNENNMIKNAMDKVISKL